MAKRDKFGSHYDPKNGKAHPKTGSDGSKAAGQTVIAKTLRVTFDSKDFEMSGIYDQVMRETMADLMRSHERSIFGRPFSWPEGGTVTAPSGPPHSYTATREKVSNWLLKAPDQRFDDIVGNEAALAMLREAVEAPVKHKALYEHYGLKMPKGALLRGPPGCGKTMFARAMASEMRRLYGGEVEFICLSGSELQSGYVGQTEERIKALFGFGREYLAYRGHPLLIFIDEAEALLPDRNSSVRNVTWFEQNQVSTFLAEMDGVRASGAFVLLATNRPDAIDQAVLRDGRCDLKITVERPTREALEVILRRNFDGVPIADGCGLDELAFAAVESFHDPHRVILEAHMIGIDFDKERVHRRDKHFLLEHIVSGAMAASIPSRAARLAFARDKQLGRASGVTVDDVVQAVAGVYEENRHLDHSFALEEFRKQFFEEAKAAFEQERLTPSPPPPRRAAGRAA